MDVAQVEPAAGLEQRGRDREPAADRRDPVDRADRGVDQVVAPAEQPLGIEHVALDEAAGDAGTSRTASGSGRWRAARSRDPRPTQRRGAAATGCRCRDGIAGAPRPARRAGRGPRGRGGRSRSAASGRRGGRRRRSRRGRCGSAPGPPSRRGCRAPALPAHGRPPRPVGRQCDPGVIPMADATTAVMSHSPAARDGSARACLAQGTGHASCAWACAGHGHSTRGLMTGRC